MQHPTSGSLAKAIACTAISTFIGIAMVTASWAGGLTCLVGADPSVAGDAAQIDALASSIGSACSCASFDGSAGKAHQDFLRCAKGVITIAVGVGQLRKQCKGTVTKYYSRSTCGFSASDHVRPCIKRVAASGKVSCSIKTAAKCPIEVGKVNQTPCAGTTMCVHAADTNRDGLINAGDSGACAPEWNLGMAQTLLPTGALGGLVDFPDEAMARVPDVPDLRLLTWAAGPQGQGTYLFEGPSVDQLQSATFVMGPGGPGTFDNGYAGIGGVHRHTDGRLYGYYHAEDWDPMIPPGSDGYPGWYGSIGAAVSDDDGSSWQKLGAAVTSALPKIYPGPSTQGVGTPSAVADPTGHYLYVYYGVAATGTLGVARADLYQGPPVPGQFSKYYAGQFAQPGVGGGLDEPLANFAVSGAFVMQPHVVYSRYLRRYVMVFAAGYFRELALITPLARSGLYVAFSEDGTDWSAPKQLVVDYVLFLTGKSLSWEPSIVWDDATGQQGWLVYGHRNSGEGPFYMVGHRIAFH